MEEGERGSVWIQVLQVPHGWWHFFYTKTHWVLVKVSLLYRVWRGEGAWLGGFLDVCDISDPQ